MKRFFTSYWSIPVVLVVLTGLYGLIVYIFNPRSHETHPRNVCSSNLKQIALGMMMYSQDYDDKLPPMIFGTQEVGWANGLQPYLKSYQLFQCSSESHPAQNNPHLPSFTDYWMNRNAASVDLNKIDGEPTKMILMGDGDGGSLKSTASYAITHLPESWRTSANSPATRHNGGANYAFLDGHVKRLKPEEVANATTSLNPGVNTFSIR